MKLISKIKDRIKSVLSINPSLTGEEVIKKIRTNKIRIVSYSLHIALILEVIFVTIGYGIGIFNLPTLIILTIILLLSTISLLSIRLKMLSFSAVFGPTFMFIAATAILYRFGPFAPSVMAYTIALILATMILSNLQVFVFTVSIMVISSLTGWLHINSSYATHTDGKYSLLFLVLGYFIYYPIVATLLTYVQNLLTNSINQVNKQTISLRKEVDDHKTTLRMLRKANTRIEKSKSEVENLFANMSHQLRTPITGINGLNELLQNTKLSRKQSNYVQNLAVASESLSQLVNDILDYSKARSSEIEINNEPFTFKQITKKLFQIQEVSATKNRNTISVHIDSELDGPMIGDSEKIAQIISNILDNSIKFTNEGKISISIESKTTVSRQNMTEAIIKISDTGIGIKKENLGKIFKSYQRSDRSIKGTGLGLAIVKQLSEILGGCVSVDSELGKGTTVTVRLPVKRTDNMKSIPQKSENDIDYSNPGIKKILTNSQVLLIEDDNLNRLIINEILKKYALDPVVAKSGNEAATILSEETFDLVITDLSMPGKLDGLKIIKIIKKINLTQKHQTKILVLSAFSNDKTINEALSTGAHSYLVKPFKNDDLLREVYLLLTK